MAFIGAILKFVATRPYMTLAITLVIYAVIAYGYITYTGSQMDALESKLGAAEQTIVTQQATILDLVRQAEAQKQLTEHFNRRVLELRDKRNDEVRELEQLKLGQEPVQDTKQLETIINNRTQQLFNDISDISRQGLTK